jgi:hypothetical protein
VKALAGVGALVAITLGLSAWAGGHASAARASSAMWPPQERSSRLVLGGRVRCTATVGSEVQAGHDLNVRLALRNVSRRAVKASYDAGYVLKAADGTTYYPDGAIAGFPRPPAIPQTLRAGATVASDVGVSVRWRGPLAVTPECQGKTLRALHVGVVAPWPGPAQDTAVAQVVAAAGHLLDHCRPQEPGVPVDGQIYPPSGTAAPMDARCSISISSAGRFLVAQVLVLTPPGLQGVQIYQPYVTLWQVGGPFSQPTSPFFQAIAWEFVVTRERAIPVAASSMSQSTRSTKSQPIWDWSGTGFGPEGSLNCGGGVITVGTGPELDFVSACPA